MASGGIVCRIASTFTPLRMHHRRRTTRLMSRPCDRFANCAVRGGEKPPRDNIECFMVLRMGALDGKVAIVTGTSRGVGVGIAHELLRAGATVIGCSRAPLDGIPGVAEQPDWVGRSAQMVCDQGDYRAIDAMVREVVKTYGRVDILVNNAGGTVPAPHVEDIPELVSRIQGAPAAEDDMERTMLFH